MSCSRFPTEGAGVALGVVSSVVMLLVATVIAVFCCLGVMVIAAVLCCLGAMGVTVPSVRHLPDKQTQLLMITVQRRTKYKSYLKIMTMKTLLFQDVAYGLTIRLVLSM